MPTLTVFNSVSLDGYFTDAKSDMSWAHKDPHDQEWNDFVGGNAKGGGGLVLGRVTYEMMKSFWPTPAAKQMAPDVAEGMNRMPKYVFSKTIDKPDWQNTTIMKGDPATEVQRLKQGSGPDLVILGSGTIVSQLTKAGLIDQFQVVVTPIILGTGRSMFDGGGKTAVKLVSSRTFKNGSVVNQYART